MCVSHMLGCVQLTEAATFFSVFQTSIQVTRSFEIPVGRTILTALGQLRLVTNCTYLPLTATKCQCGVVCSGGLGNLLVSGFVFVCLGSIGRGPYPGLSVHARPALKLQPQPPLGQFLMASL